MRLSWCNVWEKCNWHTKTISGTCRQSKGITSLCLPAEDVLIEPDDIEASPRNKDTLPIHMIKQFPDEQNVPYLQIFKLATDKKAFLKQFYGKRVWGHQIISSDNNYCGSCLGDYETGEKWLQCPRCMVWIHSKCLFHWLWTMKLNTTDNLHVSHSFFRWFFFDFLDGKKLVERGNFNNR